MHAHVCEPINQLIWHANWPFATLLYTCICSPVPSASTELFLRLESAAAQDSERAMPDMQSSNQPCAAPVPLSAGNALAVPLTQPPKLILQTDIAHDSVDQQLQLQQVLPQLPLQLQKQPWQQLPQEEEEDIYAGLERNTDSNPASITAGHTGLTAPVPCPQGLPAQALQPLLQGTSRQNPEPGFLRSMEQQGKAGTGKGAGPGAAEAPRVKQGSYAVAAKLARQRSERQQQQLEELGTSQRQTRDNATGKAHSVQVLFIFLSL